MNLPLRLDCPTGGVALFFTASIVDTPRSPLHTHAQKALATVVSHHSYSKSIHSVAYHIFDVPLYSIITRKNIRLSKLESLERNGSWLLLGISNLLLQHWSAPFYTLRAAALPPFINKYRHSVVEILQNYLSYFLSPPAHCGPD